MSDVVALYEQSLSKRGFAKAEDSDVTFRREFFTRLTAGEFDNYKAVAPQPKPEDDERILVPGDQRKRKAAGAKP